MNRTYVPRFAVFSPVFSSGPSGTPHSHFLRDLSYVLLNDILYTVLR